MDKRAFCKYKQLGETFTEGYGMQMDFMNKIENSLSVQ